MHVCVKFLGKGNNGNPEMLTAARRYVGKREHHRGRPFNHNKLECNFLGEGTTEGCAKLET